MYTPSQITQIARSANCGRQTVIDHLNGARRTTPAVAVAIEAATARILCDAAETETILARHAADPIYAAAEALNAEVTARAAAAKRAADELVAAVREATAHGIPLETAARILLKAAEIAAQKGTNQ